MRLSRALCYRRGASRLRVKTPLVRSIQIRERYSTAVPRTTRRQRRELDMRDVECPAAPGARVTSTRNDHAHSSQHNQHTRDPFVTEMEQNCPRRVHKKMHLLCKSGETTEDTEINEKAHGFLFQHKARVNSGKCN